MINNKVARAISEQANFEFVSERQYIAMEYYFKSLDLNGYAKLFHEYALEERKHAYKMLDFLDEWNCPASIKELTPVLTKFSSPKQLFEAALAHEKEVTRRIVEIYNLAKETNDSISMQFLDWYLEEQREEEDKMITRLNRLRLADSNMAAILFLDEHDGSN